MSQDSSISEKLKQYAQQLKLTRQLPYKVSHGTLNMVRFNRRVNIISSRQVDQMDIYPQEKNSMKLIDTPATAITVVQAPRHKKIRKSATEKPIVKKPQTRKSITTTTVRAKKINK
jgi:hypothetical protein